MKTFKIIYADPPWKYNDKAAAGKRGASFKYPVMDFHDLARLPVEKLADPSGAVMFMWTTGPMMADSLNLMALWGFKYKTVGFVWTKTEKSGCESFLMGNWSRTCQEFVLVGTRGDVKIKKIRKSASVRQSIRSQRLAHSEKPPETRDRIVQLLGDVPRIELFARQSIDGWTALGDGIDGQDIFAAIQHILSLP